MYGYYHVAWLCDVLTVTRKWIGDVPEWLSTWSLTQSFFVTMGGLSLPRDHPEKSTIPGDGDLCVLTSDGFLYLLERQYDFPDLSKDMINDRSKAESLTKAISMLQASWLIIEVLARVASHLTVTELEINTVAHVVGALLTYSFWFYKPLRIGHPLVIAGNELKALRMANVLKNGACAHFMYQFLHQNYHEEKATSRVRSNGVAEESRIVIKPLEEVRNSLNLQESQSNARDGEPQPSDLESSTSQQGARTINHVLKIYDPDAPPVSGLTKAKLERGLPSYAGTLYVQPTRIDPSDNFGAQGREYHSCNEDCLDRNLCYREEILLLDLDELEHFLDLWNDPERDSVLGLKPSGLGNQMCCESRWKVGLEESYWRRNLERATSRGTPLQEGVGLTHRASNWHIPQGAASRSETGISYATIFYGAIHAAAWNSHFPSAAEMWMWRVSSILATTFPLVSMVFFASSLVKDMTPRGLASPPILRSLKPFAVSVLPAYCFGRVYLVVEAFISLRSQPSSAYEMPRWLSLIPHL